MGSKMKALKKIICIMLCISFIYYLPHDTVRATDSIDEMQQEINAAKQEIVNLKSGITDIEKIKRELEQSKNDLTVYVTQLDSQLSSIQEKISEYNTLITEKELQIETTESELNDAISRQENQYEAMKKRIKFMYEKGDMLYLELIFSSEGFSDMMNKAEYIESLSSYDRNQLDEYVQTKEMISLYKDELESEKEVLHEARAAVQAEEKSVTSLISEKENQLLAVSGDIANKEAAIKEYEAQIAAENATIAALEKAVAEERARRAAENQENRIYDGGMFAWPCPSYTKISDEYGNRMHPTLGVEKFHNGLDMAAPGGSAILAAYDGEVIAADYNSSMGNYIMIDHGGELYTIYMHASALYVSKGQTVSKGQKIAAVGSTGRSTGNHLHFGVRSNGNYVNPRKYFG